MERLLGERGEVSIAVVLHEEPLLLDGRLLHAVVAPVSRREEPAAEGSLPEKREEEGSQLAVIVTGRLWLLGACLHAARRPSATYLPLQIADQGSAHGDPLPPHPAAHLRRIKMPPLASKSLRWFLGLGGVASVKKTLAGEVRQWGAAVMRAGERRRRRQESSKMRERERCSRERESGAGETPVVTVRQNQKHRKTCNVVEIVLGIL